MKEDEMTTENLYDTSKNTVGRILEDYTYSWEVLLHIGEIIQKLGETLSEEDYKRVGKPVWIHKSVEISPTTCMKTPAIICKGTELRIGCFIRGNVIIDSGAVVGDSAELKNVILFDGAQVPHYNYMGDSISGYKSHMGVSVLTSNVKSDKTLVKVHTEGGDIETGLKKFGAMLGDLAEVGCGFALGPGAVIGACSNVYSLSSVRDCVDGNCIYKREGETVEKY